MESPPSNSTVASGIPDPFATLPGVPALDNTFGAILLGTFIALILYGFTLHQSYRYYHMYPGDSFILKSLVAAVIVLETATSAMSMHVCYYYLVTSYFKPSTLRYGEWAIDLLPLVSGIVMTTTQSFFVRRVYILGRHYRALVAVAVGLCILEIGFFIAATVEAFFLHTFERFIHTTWLVSTGSTMAVSADILLTAILIYVLRRSRTGVKRTDSMLEVMIMYSVNTGLLTGMFNLLSLLFAFTSPGNMIYIGFGIPGTKMYANTLMAALNSRRSLAEKGSAAILETSPFGFSIAQPDTAVRDSSASRRPSVSHAIKMESTATTDSSTVGELAAKSGLADEYCVDNVWGSFDGRNTVQ